MVTDYQLSQSQTILCEWNRPAWHWLCASVTWWNEAFPLVSIQRYHTSTRGPWSLRPPWPVGTFSLMLSYHSLLKYPSVTEGQVLVVAFLAGPARVKPATSPHMPHPRVPSVIFLGQKPFSEKWRLPTWQLAPSQKPQSIDSSNTWILCQNKADREQITICTVGHFISNFLYYFLDIYSKDMGFTEWANN